LSAEIFLKNFFASFFDFALRGSMRSFKDSEKHELCGRWSESANADCAWRVRPCRDLRFRLHTLPFRKARAMHLALSAINFS
jgi:hypothetical protein